MGLAVGCLSLPPSKPESEFTAQEARGAAIYQMKCARCHYPTTTHPLTGSGCRMPFVATIEARVGVHRSRSARSRDLSDEVRPLPLPDDHASVEWVGLSDAFRCHHRSQSRSSPLKKRAEPRSIR